MPWSSRILMALASILAVVGLLGAWADRQLLDNDEWTDTSAALLREPDVRDPVADAISGQIADGSRATALLEQNLPPRLRPLAPQGGVLVREGAQRATRRLLAAPKVQALWVDANRRTHEQVVDLVHGEGTVVAGRGVVLDLRPLAKQIARRAGFGGDRIEKLPNPTSRVVLLKPDQLKTLRQIGDVLGALSWVPALLSFLLYALAVWLAKGDRRRALLVSGLSLVGVGLVLLLARRVGGHELVDAVAAQGPYEPTASTVWRIVTTLLADLAVVVILAGAVTTAGAWLAGPGGLATRLRALVAPALAGEPAISLGLATLTYLALLAWGPLAVLRRPLAIVLLGALLLAGVWALRQQVVREQQSPTPGDGNSPG